MSQITVRVDDRILKYLFFVLLIIYHVCKRRERNKVFLCPIKVP
jgi:hypothetical protein